MKSTDWRMILAACGALALVAGTAACTKDAESRGIEAAPAATETEKATPDPSPVPTEGETATPVEPDPAPKGAKAVTKVGKAAPEAGGMGGGSKTISKKWYTLKIDVPKGAAKGSESKISFTLIPSKGWKINQEFPTKLQVVPPSGVQVSKDTLKKGDAAYFSEKKATFEVAFTASNAGSKSFSGKFKFAVCTDATCDPKTEKLAFAVDVK